MIVAVIPARGGSKRIPRKNIRDFASRPIIAYSIAAAHQCGLFDRIIVSTDDDAIAAVAGRFGAETPFVRPAELSDDRTGTNPVVAHAIRWLKEQGQEVTVACCIYATAPFLTGSDLQRGHDILTATGKSFAFSVTSFAAPVQRALRLPADGGVALLFPEWAASRSQDLEEAYHDAGQFYWGRARAFIDGVPLFSDQAAPVILPRHRVQDIDTPEDWRHAELLYAAWTASAPEPV